MERLRKLYRFSFSMNKKQWNLLGLGCYIREKLDKRGFNDAWFYASSKPSEFISHIKNDRTRIENEVIGPMKRFIELFDELSK